ncbi:MAG TPA: hypothetical protein VGM17_09530 [Rhizomicrobium sp.]
MTLSNVMKTTAFAALLGVAALAGSARTASAATFETRCYGDDCYRVRCDDAGFDCQRIENLGDVAYIRHRDRLMCDADGDDCHWVRERVYEYDNDQYDNDEDDGFPD